MAVANALNLEDGIEQVHPAVRALIRQVGSTTSLTTVPIIKSARMRLARIIEYRMSSQDALVTSERVDAGVRCAQECVDAERRVFYDDRLRYNATARDKYHAK